MVKRRMGIMALLISLFLCFIPCSALAGSSGKSKGQIDLNRECSLTLSYRSAGKKFSGQTVKLYQIAEVSADGQYTLNPSFASSGLVLNGIQTNGEWKVIRSTLEAYILANRIAPEMTAVTDKSGQVCFSGLTPGLYLTSAVEAVNGEVTCLFDPVLVALPGQSTDGFWQYQISVTAKPEALPPISPDEKAEYKVLV